MTDETRKLVPAKAGKACKSLKLRELGKIMWFSGKEAACYLETMLMVVM